MATPEAVHLIARFRTGIEEPARGIINHNIEVFMRNHSGAKVELDHWVFHETLIDYIKWERELAQVFGNEVIAVVIFENGLQKGLFPREIDLLERDFTTIDKGVEVARKTLATYIY